MKSAGLRAYQLYVGLPLCQARLQWASLHAFYNYSIACTGFSPEIFEGVVAISGVVKLDSITNVTQKATKCHIV